MKNIYVFGHKNPDTDSVCSAIALANLKNCLGYNCVPKVIGQINRESRFVLDYFKIDYPSYINDVKVQIKDVKYIKKAYINESDSINSAIEYMKNHDLTAVPLVDDKRILTGYVTLKDIAKYLIGNKRDYIKTNLTLLLKTLDAKVINVVKDEFEGNIQTVAFSSSDFIKEVSLDEKSILITSDRYKVLEHAIKSKVQLIIMIRDKQVPKKLLQKAKKNNVSIISSSYGSYDLCSKVCLANYIKIINSTLNPYTIDINSYYTDFLSLTKKFNYTNYPIVKKNNECVGVLRLVDTSIYEKKKVMLVDHNNYEQSVDGLNEAEILEIIDHHNIGSIGTNSPISFICRPVGCTATIVYEQYKKERIRLHKDMAGLLLSAIISDTLLFTSPTTTELDKSSAFELASLAHVDVYDYGREMLKAASSIKGLTVNELINQDFKSYSINDKTYGIAVLTTMDYDEISKDMQKYIDKINEMSEVSFESVLIFIVDIIKQGSYILYNTKSEELVSSAFNLKNVYEGVFVKGLLSRKKQILPALMERL